MFGLRFCILRNILSVFLFEPVVNTYNDSNENGWDPFMVLLKYEMGKKERGAHMVDQFKHEAPGRHSYSDVSVY